MSERGSHFEYYSRSPEESLSAEIKTILAHTEDPLIREVVAKLLETLRIKTNIRYIQSGADQVNFYQDMKQLGIFWVRLQTASFSWQDQSQHFSINEGDLYLDLHIPPLSADKKNFRSIRDSFELVAKYIEVQRLKPRYVLGITYEQLGAISRRYGFTVITPELPTQIKDRINRVYRDFRPNGRNDMGNVVLCFQTTDQFSNHFRVKMTADTRDLRNLKKRNPY